LILHALGGQGKSQIALEYCRRCRDAYRGIFWIFASSATTATQSFEGISTELGLGTSADLGGTDAVIRVVKDTLESWDERWLLVFDDYNCPEDFSNIKEFIPLGNHLFTLSGSGHY
jgi:hypothetical protein